tara:strand:- start:166 stop:324 length:159 start_codon:yes stop_codon:yes gene_type:complete
VRGEADPPEVEVEHADLEEAAAEEVVGDAVPVSDVEQLEATARAEGQTGYEE